MPLPAVLGGSFTALLWSEFLWALAFIFFGPIIFDALGGFFDNLLDTDDIMLAVGVFSMIGIGVYGAWKA